MTDKCFKALWKIATYQDPAVVKEKDPAENDKGFKPQPPWLPPKRPAQPNPQPKPQNNNPQNWYDRIKGLQLGVKKAAADPVKKPEPPQPMDESKQIVADPSNALPDDHVVQRGENPTTIAKKRGQNLREFMRINGLNEQNSRKLKPGQRLKLVPKSN